MKTSCVDDEGGVVKPGAGEGSGGMGEGLWKRGWVVWLVIVGAAVLAHGMALKADFYMDDQAHILQRETGKVAKGMEYGYRQVTALAWDGIYGVFGASSVAFHAFNLVLHAAVAVLVWAVGRQLGRRLVPGDSGGVADWGALAGALLFATHPLMTEGVNYAQNASLQLVTLFTMGAVWCCLRYLEGGRPQWVAGVAGCLVLSAFTKEVGLVYTGLSVGLVWLVAGWGETVALARRHPRNFKMGLVVLAPILVYFVWYGTRLASNAVRAPMWVENFFTQGRLFWSYLRLMVWPSGLCADHLVPLSGVGLADPGALVATLGAGGLLVVLVAGLRLPGWRQACLLLLVGLIPLVMRFAYVSKELFVEYRAYAAFPWIALAVGSVAAPWLRRYRAGAVALLVVVATCAVVSAQRSTTWSDAGRLAEDAIRKYPNHIRARTHLQKLALEAGDLDRVLALRDEARQAFESLKAYNQAPGQARKYEASMPYRGYLCSEHFVSIALTEREGSAAGLRHAAEVIEVHRRLHPEFFDPNHDRYEIVEQIVDIHSVLLHHGAAYDERRKQAAAAAAAAASERHAAQ